MAVLVFLSLVWAFETAVEVNVVTGRKIIWFGFQVLFFSFSLFWDSVISYLVFPEENTWCFLLSYLLVWAILVNPHFWLGSWLNPGMCARGASIGRMHIGLLLVSARWGTAPGLSSWCLRGGSCTECSTENFISLRSCFWKLRFAGCALCTVLLLQTC